MVKEELAAGLKNALVRGQSLEQAMQSFINAGYNPQEVRAAGAEFSQSGQSYNPPIEKSPINQREPVRIQKDFTIPMPTEAAKLPRTEVGKKKESGKVLIAAIIIMLLIFAGSLGYLIYYLAT